MMIWNSLLVAGGGAASSVAIALLVLVAGNSASIVSRKLVQALLLGVLFVPTYVIVGGWTTDFGTPSWLTVWIPKISPVYIVGKPWLSILVVTGLYGVTLFPFAFLLLQLGISRTNRSSRILARMEGGTWSAIFQGFLPTAWAWIVISGSLLGGLISADMFISNLYQVTTLTEFSYQELVSGKTGFGSAAGILAVAWSFVILFSSIFIQKRSLIPILPADQTLHQASIVRSTVRRWISETTLWILVFLLTITPWTNLILKAGFEAIPEKNSKEAFVESSYKWSGLKTLENLSRVPASFADEFYWSGSLCAVSATFATLVGVPLAFLFTKTPTTVRTIAPPALLLLLFLPGPTVNQLVATMMQFNAFYWYDEHTLLAPVLCMQFRLVPIVVCWSYWFWKQWYLRVGNAWTIDQSLPIGSKLKIMMRPLGGSIIRMWGILFLVSFSDLSSYILCLPPGVTTISMRVFELLHYGVRFQEASLLLFVAIAGLLLGLTFTVIGLWLSNDRIKEDSSWI